MKTNKYFVLLLLIAFTCISVSVCYSQEQLGNIQGKLFDRQSNEPISSHTLTLNIHKAGKVTKQQTTTDENGIYNFENLSIDATTHYSISTIYKGFEHIEKDIVLSSFVPNLEVNINIGGITDDITKIRIKTYTIVIGPPPAEHPHAGALSIIEAFDVENASDLSFQTTFNNEQVGFYLPLPKDYEEFQPRAPQTLGIDDTKEHVFLTEPLRPGLLQVGFTYIYHGVKNRLDISRALPFAIDQISIFIPETITLVPISNSFKPVQRQQIHNAIYTIYQAAPTAGFPSGTKLELGLKPRKKETNIGQIAFIAIAAALAGGFLVAAFFTLRRETRSKNVPETAESIHSDTGWLRKLNDADLEHARTTRLEFITTLDEMHENNDISDRVYNRIRKEQTDRLTEIMVQSKERGLNN